MLQADPENAPEKTPANPPFIKDMTKVLVDAAKLTPNDRILFSFGYHEGTNQLNTLGLP
jgi:hypothetical protein